MATAGSKKQSPAFYVLIICLIIMAIGPIMLMLATSFKTNVDVNDVNVSAFFFAPFAFILNAEAYWA